MSFAAAAFLAGLAALVLPWWLHRREAHSIDKRTVSSLFLMRASEAPEHTHKRLEHRLLLALRLLLLAVLVFAFAQPLLERASPAGPTAAPEPARIVVLDTSLSMAPAFEEARTVARSLIDDLPTGGRAALITADDGLTLAAPLGGEPAPLRAAIVASKAGAARLAFDGLLGRLAALTGTLTDDAVAIHLISDFQASALPGQFNALIAGAAAPVMLHPIGDPAPNWQIAQVAPEADAVRVTVNGFATPARQMSVRLDANGSTLGERVLAVPAGGSAVATFPAPPAGRREVALTARIAADDALPLDDVRYRVIPRPQATPLPLAAAPSSKRQLEYLTTAVAAAAPRFQPAGLDARGPVMVLVDPGVPSADRRRRIERHLADGGAVLMTVGPITRRAGRLPLIDAPLASTRFESTPQGVVAVDSSHPLLARFADWHDVEVYEHLALESPAAGDVLMALDDGTPLLVEHRLGAGRVLVLMTALDPQWSSLVVRPAFVGFVADALAYLAEDLLPARAIAGQAVAIPAQAVQLFDGAGNRVLALGETVGRPTVRVAAPGLYTLRTPSVERLVAVNTDARESDLRRADAALLARWQRATAGTAGERVTAAAPAAGPHRLPLAPWLLALLVLLAVLEPLAANAGRREVAA